MIGALKWVLIAAGVVVAVAFALVGAYDFWEVGPFGFGQPHFVHGQGAGAMNLWEFLILFFLFAFVYKVICLFAGKSSRHDRKTGSPHAAGADAGRLAAMEERLERLEGIDERLERLNEAVGEVKRDTESLAEDYRFIQRVLDKE